MPLTGTYQSAATSASPCSAKLLKGWICPGFGKNIHGKSGGGGACAPSTGVRLSKGARLGAQIEIGSKRIRREFRCFASQCLSLPRFRL